MEACEKRRLYNNQKKTSEAKKAMQMLRAEAQRKVAFVLKRTPRKRFLKHTTKHYEHYDQDNSCEESTVGKRTQNSFV